MTCLRANPQCQCDSTDTFAVVSSRCSQRSVLCTNVDATAYQTAMRTNWGKLRLFFFFCHSVTSLRSGWVQRAISRVVTHSKLPAVTVCVCYSSTSVSIYRQTTRITALIPFKVNIIRARDVNGSYDTKWLCNDYCVCEQPSGLY